jgi:hypothetical protein
VRLGLFLHTFVLAQQWLPLHTSYVRGYPISTHANDTESQEV